MSDQWGSRTQVRLPEYESWFYQHPVSGFGGDILLSFAVPSHTDCSGERPNRWLIALGDVAGKGEVASRLKDSLETDVLRLVGETTDPVAILDRLNTIHCDDVWFATLVVAVIDAVRHELTFASAGHPSPLLRRGDGQIETLGEEVAGLPLWVDREQTYRKVSVPITPGEVVVFWSDGVTAEVDGECNIFTFARFLQAITQADRNARSVGRSIVKAVTDFRGGRKRVDDISLLCLGRVIGERAGKA
jgi:serine phosphatase RsbU (regulator of sigma subunit)